MKRKFEKVTAKNFKIDFSIVFFSIVTGKKEQIFEKVLWEKNYYFSSEKF
jgi:hypothetical protein